MSPTSADSRVADDPAVERSTPRRSEHDQTEGHDQRILDQTESTTDPISLNTDEDLSDNNTDDLQVVDSGDPIMVANEVRGGPALWPDGSVQARQVSNGKETRMSQRSQFSRQRCNSRVAFGEKTETANHVALAVGRQGGQRVRLEHSANSVPFPLGLGIALRVDPFLTLLEWQIGLKSALRLAPPRKKVTHPVDTVFGVRILWSEILEKRVFPTPASNIASVVQLGFSAARLRRP